MVSPIERWLLDSTVGRLTTAAVGILVIHVLLHSLRQSLTRDVEESRTRHYTRKFITLTGYLADVLIIVAVFGRELGSVVVALGVAGAGVAFALQEVIASLAGWFATSFGDLYHTGDRVRLGETMGDVIDIGVLWTTLMECGQWVNSDLYNGRIVHIANSLVLTESVFNYSSSFPFLWDEITLPVKYGSDYRLTREIPERVVNEIVGECVTRARTEWKRVAKKYMVEDERVEPMVTMAANDNWVEFTVRYVVRYKERRIIKDQMFTRILEEFDRTDGRVAIASTTIHLVQTPVFDVRLADR
jgi:small-conductance mechanosensitive channel